MYDARRTYQINRVYDWQYLRDLWSSQQEQEGKKQLKKVKKNTNFISPIQSGQTIDGKGRGLCYTRY